MIVIGADTHKRTHALAAVDAGTGRQCGARQIGAEEPGYLAAVRWGRGLDDVRVWAIEDCRHVSRGFEEALIAAVLNMTIESSASRADLPSRSRVRCTTNVERSVRLLRISRICSGIVAMMAPGRSAGQLCR
jgi:hypothetical protein